MATPAMSARSANGGLRQYLANKLLDLADKLLGRKASSAISQNDAPALADRQLIGEMVSWWMKHDPLDASRRMVDAVGLGGAYHLPESERLRLARAFLAMLDVAATFAGDHTDLREPASPRPSRSKSRTQTGREAVDESSAVASADGHVNGVPHPSLS